MAFFTKNQVAKAIRGGESKGFSGEDIVNEMISQGHELEGLNAPERRTPGAFPIEQNTGGISQVGKQLFNVGAEAFQMGKGVLSDPGGFVGAVGKLAVGGVEDAIETSSEAVSDIGGFVGLDIPSITMPTFHSDGTVTFEKDTPEQDVFHGIAQTIGERYGISSALRGDLSQAGRDIEKTLFEAPLTSALDVVGGKALAAQRLPRLSKGTKVAKADRPSIVKTAAKGVGDELLQKSTGLGKENIRSIVQKPDLYAKAETGEITRGSIAHKIKSGIDTRLKEIGEAGRVYDGIRQSGQVVTIGKAGVQSVLKKYGIDFDDTGRIKIGSESRPLSGSDIRELEEFFSQYGSEKLTSNGFLNAREKLSQFSGFEATRTDVMNNLARDLRSHYNTIGRPQIKGLKELDNAYAPEVGKIRDIKKEYLRTVVDESGQRVTTLKDNAASRIMGATNKGREEILRRLDDISPGIGDEIRVLKALEDVQLATGNKIGTYFRSGVGVLGIASLNVPLIVAAIVTSPSVIARILEWYGRAKGNGAAADIMIKMKRTGKLSVDEKAFVQDAIQTYENAQKIPSPKALPPSGGEAMQGLKESSVIGENRMIGLKGSEDLAQRLREAKGLTSDQIMSKHTDIQLKRDVPATDIYGNKVTIPEGEVLTPYELKGNKIMLQDGETYIVSKNQYQNIKGNSISGEAKEFAPELKGVEESVRGGKKAPEVTSMESLGGEYKDVYEVKFNDGESVEIDVSGAGDNRTKAEIKRLALEKRAEDAYGDFTSDTKYSQYQLPGGENYKEVLIKAKNTPETNSIANVSKDGSKYVVEWSDGTRQSFNKATSIEEARQFAIDYQKQGLVKSSNFKSSHWDEPNVISHLRLNERTYKGKKVTFMEEMQSDWAREGRKQGFSGEKGRKAFDDYVDTLREKYNTDALVMDTKRLTPAELSKYQELFDSIQDFGEGVPNHPLLKNWQELSVKRALKEAVDNNSEYFSWITGEQTSARYNLDTKVEKVSWEQRVPLKSETLKGETEILITPKDGAEKIMFLVDKDGMVTNSTVRSHANKKLDEVLGKGLADKIMEKESGTLAGEGLKFGGEWAENLYDKQIKNIVEDLTGGKVEMIDLSKGGEKYALYNKIDGNSIGGGYSLKEAQAAAAANPSVIEYKLVGAEEGAGRQQAIRITPEIRAKVRGEALKLKKSSNK